MTSLLGDHGKGVKSSSLAKPSMVAIMLHLYWCTMSLGYWSGRTLSIHRTKQVLSLLLSCFDAIVICFNWIRQMDAGLVTQRRDKPTP